MLRETVKEPSEAVIRYSFNSLLRIRKERNIDTLKKAITAKFVTLNDILQVFGKDTLSTVIDANIITLCKMSNVERLEDEQIVVLTDLIYEQFTNEKMTVLNEFFKRIIGGYYGRFFGALDVIRIMEDCHTFKKELYQAKLRLEKEQEQEARREAWESREVGVPMPDWFKEARGICEPKKTPI